VNVVVCCIAARNRKYIGLGYRIHRESKTAAKDGARSVDVASKYNDSHFLLHVFSLHKMERTAFTKVHGWLSYHA
jgi:hypothetical protein